ncbi:sulfotransferase family protein [Rhodopirellula sp. JC639]|uniref:sulfotransferase family protein n=1 Tax=Stieleria mannarensis TaxID=2755585 RepID=UPI0016008647|nr:sulfotransferase [Rhodopirellula sp. JC639]
MTIQDIDVTYRPNLDEILHGFEIHEPPSGGGSDSNSIRLDGWALARRGKVRRLQLMHGGVPWKSIPVTLHSSVAAKRHADVRGSSTCGFRGSFGTLGLPPQFRIDVFAVLQNGNRLHCAVITGTRHRVPTNYSPRLCPLTITSLARTGTTRMMQTLHQHPSIVLDNQYPFEARPAGYWFHMLKVLAEPSSGKNTFEADLTTLPPCPFHSEVTANRPPLRNWFETTYVHRTAEFAQQNIDQLYQQIALTQGKADVRYFAEKSLPCHLQWIARELYRDAREIILVRDFRDMVCSMISFNHKRGFATFGRENVESDADFIRMKRHDAQRLMAVARARHPQSLLVRYEDLVLDTETTLTRIFQYLQIDDAPTLVADIIDQHRRESGDLDFHRTTADEGASVGRWQTDLPPKLRVLCNEVFGELLTEAGYDV